MGRTGKAAEIVTAADDSGSSTGRSSARCAAAVLWLLASACTASDAGQRSDAPDAAGASSDSAQRGRNAYVAARRDSVVEVDLSRFFPDMDAAFVVLDVERGVRYVHDRVRADSGFRPASTFKIPNTLIALETGVATPDLALAWDSIAAPPKPYWPASWKQSHTLRSAFRNSVYWYYQEIARRIGEPRMRDWLARFDYGNRSIGGGLDRFWLEGELRISPNEQVEFLRRLLAGELGVSETSMATLRELALVTDSAGHRLSGKTGTAEVTPTRELGWMVGWLERGDALYIYALNMEGERVWEDWPPGKRADLVARLFGALAVAP